jgi:hypothetical protein
MAAAQILAVGSGAASSDDFTVTSGETVSLCLNDATGPDVVHGAKVRIELKDPAGRYFEVGALFSDHNGRNVVAVISAAGTYRVTRLGDVACGVFRPA